MTYLQCESSYRLAEAEEEEEEEKWEKGEEGEEEEEGNEGEEVKEKEIQRRSSACSQQPPCHSAAVRGRRTGHHRVHLRVGPVPQRRHAEAVLVCRHPRADGFRERSTG